MTSHVRKQTPFSHLFATYPFIFARVCKCLHKNRRCDARKRKREKKQRRPIESKSWVCAQHTYQSTRIDKINQIKPQSTNFGHYSSFPINPTNQSSILNIHIYFVIVDKRLCHICGWKLFFTSFFSQFFSPKLTEK